MEKIKPIIAVRLFKDGTYRSVSIEEYEKKSAESTEKQKRKSERDKEEAANLKPLLSSRLFKDKMRGSDNIR